MTAGGLSWRCVLPVVLLSLAGALAGCSRTTTTTGNNGGASSDSAVPQIATPPASQTVYQGSAVLFGVVATGSAPLTFQWKLNGNAIPGANSSAYKLDNTPLADNDAKLTVTVSNLLGSITSASATLTVLPATPSIVAQPQPQSVLAGATAAFSVQAAGSPPLRFQWMKNGSPITGATAADYITPATSLGDSGSQFSVVVTNAYGTVSSAAAALTVAPVQVPPTITGQPQNVTAAVGGSATFTVVATGTQLLSYQWYANTVAIPGANAASYTIASVAYPQNQTSYTVTVSNIAGSVSSNAAILTVTRPPGRIDLVAGMLGGAGNLDALGTAARFYQAGAVATDAAGDVFVADTYNSTIREISPGGTVTTIAGNADINGYSDGVGTDTLFNFPQGVAVDSNGDIYVADTNNGVIRKITPAGVVTTLAGTPGTVGSADGPGASATFGYIQRLAVDLAGNVYVADSGNNTIRKVTPAGDVSTLAGTAQVAGSTDGAGSTALFNGPQAVAVDAAGNVYVADTGNFTIRVIDVTDTVSTLAGTPGVEGWADGAGAAAQFDQSSGIAVDQFGNLFVSDTYSDTIREVTPGGVVTTFAGAPYTDGLANGTGAAASFKGPLGIAVDAGDNVYVADFRNQAIREITASAVVSTFAGLPPHPGSADGSGSAAQFDTPLGVAVDGSGNMYIADTSNGTIRLVTPTGVVTTIAGTPGVTGSADGTGPAAQFNGPQAIAMGLSGSLYVADTGNNTIRMVTPAGVVTTVAGTAGVVGASDGTGAAAAFNAPVGLVADRSGNLFVADSGNNTIRVINPVGAVTTAAGTAGVAGSTDGPAAVALFNAPIGLAFDSIGNLYISDSQNFTVRVMSPTQVVSTLAGTAGQTGFADGTGTAARFTLPSGLATDANDNLYVVDSFFRTVRSISPAGVVTTVAGNPATQGVALGPLAGSLNGPFGIAVIQGTPATLIVPDADENSVLRIVLP